MSRREIAELAEIPRAMLSVWKARHANFPRPKVSEEGDLFVLAEMIEWLTSRRISDERLLPTERKGSTYADRILRKLGQRETAQPSGAASSTGSGARIRDVDAALAELFGPLANRVRGAGPREDYLQLLLCAVFVRIRARDQWARITDLANTTVADQGDPARLLDALGLIVDGVLREHGVLPGVRPVFARLRPEAAEDVSQVLRTCHQLDADAFQAIFERFAAWGRRDSSEFFTPSSIVGLVTAVLLSDIKGRLRCHDPYVRRGEFLAGAAAAIENVEMSGQGTRLEQLRLAAMNIAVHGADAADLQQGDALAPGEFSGRRVMADVIMTNPPFNHKSAAEWPVPVEGWPFQAPPKKNGNFAWLQYVFASLRGGGRAAVVMPNQASMSEDKDELAIRAAMIEAGAVECVVALPSGLFANTPVPVSIWFLARAHEAKGSVLLIDAREAGEKRGGQRRLRERDITEIVECYREWQTGTDRLRPKELDKGGSAVAVGYVDIKRLGYSLNPADHRPGSGATASANAVPLRTFCEIQAGPSNAIIQKLEPVDEGVPIIAPAQLRHRRIADEHTKRISSEAAAKRHKFQLRADDILCARTGTLGPCAIADHSHEGMLFGTGLLRLRIVAPGKVDPLYLLAFLALPSTQAWINNKAAGKTIASISSGDLGKLLVPLPSLEEQRRIGAELAAADATITSLSKQIIEAEKIRTTDGVALFTSENLLS